MQKNYLEDKGKKKKSALKMVWLLGAIGAIFIMVIIRFAASGGGGFSTGLPTSDEAYEVAKDFAQSTVKSSSVDFPDSGYQFAKESDSVYVIKSFMEAESESGDKRKTDFTVTIKFNGGQKTNKKNWTLLNISQNQ